MDFNARESEIVQAFRKWGIEFMGLRMLLGDDGKFRGVAFGCCKNKEMVNLALEKNG